MAYDLKIHFDDSDALAGMKKIAEAGQQVVDKFKEIDRASGGLSDAMKKRMEQAQKAVGEVVDAMEGLKKATEEETKAMDKATGSGNKFVALFKRVGDGVSGALGHVREFGAGILEGIDGINLFGLSLGKLRKAMAAFLATPIGAILAIGGAISAGAKALFDYNIAAEEAQREIEEMTGLTGELNRNLNAQAVALEKAYGVKRLDSIKAARAAVNSFGGSYAENMDVIRDGLAKAGPEQDKFLDSIDKYAPKLAKAGFTFEEFSNIINTGIETGIGDDLAESISEAQRSITVQSKETKQALENAFGSEFSQDLLGRVADGTTKTKDAIFELAQEAERVGINAQQSGELTDKFFREAGNAAGGAQRIFDALNQSIDENNNALTEMQQLNAETAEAYERIEIAKDKAFRIGGVSRFIAIIKNSLLNAFAQILEDIEIMGVELRALARWVGSGFAKSFNEFKSEIQFEDERERLEASMSELNRAIVEGVMKRNDEIVEDEKKKQQEITEEQRKALERREQAAKDMIERIRKAAQAAEIELIADQRKKAQVQYELAIKEVEAQENKLLELLGQKRFEDLEMAKEFNTLKLLAERELYKKMRAIQLEEYEKMAEIKSGADIRQDDETDAFEPIDFEDQASQREAALEGMTAAIAEQNAKLAEGGYKISLTAADQIERIQDKFWSALGLDSEEKIEQFKEIFSEAFSSIFDAFQNSIQDQISAQDSVIRQLQTDERRLQSEIEAQIDAKEEGFANSVDARKQELKEVQKAEEEAFKKRAELQRQQARITLAQNAIEQGTNLATAATNLIKNFSNVPFVGIVLAGLAITSMYSLFKSAKQQAQSASQGPSLFGGATMIGQVLAGGEDDTPGRGGKGYHVTTRKGRILGTIGGDEGLVPGPSMRANMPFMGRLINGEFDSMDLEAAIDASTFPIQYSQEVNREMVPVLVNGGNIAPKDIETSFKRALREHRSEEQRLERGRVHRVREDGLEVIYRGNRRIVIN